METRTDPVGYGTTLKDRADARYKEIQVLFGEVNNDNKISRNSRCRCGSGKKWKKCCIVEHENKTLELEQMVRGYRELCIEYRKTKK